MIPNASGTMIDVCMLCTKCIPFDQAVTVCTLTVLASVILAVIAYKVGVWLRRE